MNKGEFVNKVADNLSMSHGDVNKVLNEMINVITESLQAKEKVNITGFGSFEVKHKNARNGRNPSTGETIKIAAKDVPAFKPGSQLRESLK